MTKVIIDNHAYEMSNLQLKEVLKQIKSWHKNQNIILAVEKDGVTTLLKHSYPTSEEMVQAIKEWQNKGYRVKYNRKVC